MHSSKTLGSTKLMPEVVDGFIVTFTDIGLPDLEARRMVRLDPVHFKSIREDDGHKVYTLAEGFFMHELPAYIRLRELLKAQRLHHQLLLDGIEEELKSVDVLIEDARLEDK